MKRTGCLLLLIVFLCAGVSAPAHAQFWKRWFHKKEEKRYYPKKPKATTKDKTATSKKQAVEEYPATVKKNRYRVDVFAPLYLDELVKNNRPTFKSKLPDKAVNGLDFYEGIKLAADTLNELGYNIDLFMHDVSQAAESPDALITRKVLDSSDLLIGAVHNVHIPALAAFAKKKNINFVSAYSPSDAGVKNNPFFIQMQPSLQSHCEWITEAIRRKAKNKTPVIIYRTSVRIDSNAYGYLGYGDGEAKRISFNYFPTREKMAKLLDSTATNLIVMPILNSDYAEKILIQLRTWFPTYLFDVYGMPSWRSMPTLRKPDAFPNTVVYVTSAYYFDVSTGPGVAVAGNYKEDVGGKPSDMVFRGYETLYWYSYLLNKYGTVFDTKFSDNAAAPFTRFDVKAKRDKDGKLMYQENTHIYLYRFQSSSFIVEQN